MYQWFILVKYQKYIIFQSAIKSPLSGGLREGESSVFSNHADYQFGRKLVKSGAIHGYWSARREPYLFGYAFRLRIDLLVNQA